MSSYLIGLTLIAVIWLAFWSVKDNERPSATWWPFAMRVPAKPSEARTLGSRLARARAGRGAGGTGHRTWRRSGS
jgi:lysylphosphatidylglycerol synthetase-like protein (DUF2156 family)